MFISLTYKKYSHISENSRKFLKSSISKHSKSSKYWEWVEKWRNLFVFFLVFITKLKLWEQPAVRVWKCFLHECWKFSPILKIFFAWVQNILNCKKTENFFEKLHLKLHITWNSALYQEMSASIFNTMFDLTLTKIKFGLRLKKNLKIISQVPDFAPS